MTNGKPIIFVTRDIERALGIAPNLNYRIVANRTRYAELVKKRYPDFIHLTKSDEETLSTALSIEE